MSTAIATGAELFEAFRTRTQKTLKFPDDIKLSADAKDLIKRFVFMTGPSETRHEVGAHVSERLDSGSPA